MELSSDMATICMMYEIISTCFFTSDSDFFFFTFPKKWVGRAMGNETFYGDGLRPVARKQ